MESPVKYLVVIALWCNGMLVFAGKAKEPVESPPPSSEPDVPIGPASPARLRCAADEYQYWGNFEEGCKALVSIKPGSCICNEGLYRREYDWLCVEQKDCEETHQRTTVTVAGRSCDDYEIRRLCKSKCPRNADVVETSCWSVRRGKSSIECTCQT